VAAGDQDRRADRRARRGDRRAHRRPPHRAGLLGLDHRGRTRARFSVNALSVTRRFEGGTAALGERLAALRRCAQAGFPVGLTIAPVMPVQGWREEYAGLLRDAAAAVDGVPGVDLTVELITHRFTPGSRDVLMSWIRGPSWRWTSTAGG